jgi:dGTPase
MKYNYEKLFIPFRLRPTTISGRLNLEEFYSDHSRIIYSSSFRRLQQKAQVFPLEPNSSVRTRLTHSLEVADLGRTLAFKIATKLNENEIIQSELIQQFVAVIENACLLHDLGNPPFGHFGEEAIKRWFIRKWEECAREANVNISVLENKVKDFIEFDGNPQGIRIATRLHCENDQFGLNLSLPTILSAIKYTRCTDEDPDDCLKKKPGYFQTETLIVNRFYEEIGLDRNQRYPLVYITEAADDIAYCLSDITDGIEKRIISPEEFIDNFLEEWKKNYEDEPPVPIPNKKINYFNMEVSVGWSRKIMFETIDSYLANHDRIYNGTASSLINEDGIGRVLKIVKKVARKRLYRSPEAENIELSGYKIISGLLDHFSNLLRLKRSDFELFTEENYNPAGKGFDLEWRLFNRISPRCVRSYKYQISEFKADNDIEWFLRAHLILDHISNMTDGYALGTYQMLEGIHIKV